ncbi:MAG TPA: VWA domain-containing protein [Terriglobales bacterium]|jgi:VWFA-related protein|nr:VWA domain-containing protein [Terriglobales bacterium]
MRIHSLRLLTILTAAVALWFSADQARAQQQTADAAAPAPAAPTIKVESRVVLVDTVVTDKQGNYIRDLAMKDFKVWEDNKEQVITSFSFGDDPASPTHAQKQYLVLFFDNSTMDAGDQGRARKAAADFIDANTGPNRLIAVVDFGGTVHISQNFTADVDRLKQVVATVKGSAVSPNNAPPPVQVASLGTPGGMVPILPSNSPSLSNSESDFGARSALLALRSLAKNLATVPGRKTLVMLTSGFAMNFELQSELTATIDACNKANVAVYPIDVRGLAGPALGQLRGPRDSGSQLATKLSSGHLVFTTFDPDADSQPRLLFVQHGGGGGTGGGGGGGVGGGGGHGGGTGGGTAGGTGGHSGGTPGGVNGTHGNPSTSNTSPQAQYNYNQQNYQPRDIVPQFPPSATTNQQVLYQLADGTGGFVILNTNDLLGGLQKIAKDQSQYYVLGYTPSNSAEGSCHSLKVKVERSGTTVRSRSGYCKVKPQDSLQGSPVEKDLENRVTAAAAGNINATMQAPFFYTANNTAKVDLVIDIPTSALKFEKVKGKQHSSVNVLGIAYNSDGSVAARFSDTMDLDFDDKKELQEFQSHPFHYENQFEVASGQYNLKVAFSSGSENFGKLQTPLVIAPYTAKQFSLSALALSNELHRVSDMGTGLDAELLEDKRPLVAQGMQITPSASNHFKTTDMAAVYVELYEPLLAGPNPPKVGLELKIVDRKSGAQKIDAGFTNTASAISAGNPIVPLGMKLPVNSLPPGSYRVEVTGLDSAGNSTKPSAADFEVD